jgi:branched-chain amino acid transport system substrate-binding protein
MYDRRRESTSSTQGMYLTDPWYWNMNADSRAWSRIDHLEMHRGYSAWAPAFLISGPQRSTSAFRCARSAAGVA